MASSFTQASLAYSPSTSCTGRRNTIQESEARFVAQKSFVSTPNFSASKLVLQKLSSNFKKYLGVRVPRATVEVVENPIVGNEKLEEDRILRVGVICGGQSAERGISLNSARSVIDHIQLESLGVLTINKEVRSKEELLNMPILDVWHDLTKKLKCETLCVKPSQDGCSTGVARLCCTEDLIVYANALHNCLPRLPSNSLSKAHGVIEMPNPPPEHEEALARCKQNIELIANTLGVEGFSRIDAFVNVDSGEVLIIEVNTVPGMTPSTVLIHQALAEHHPMYPQQFFRALLDLASLRSNK